MTMQRQASKVDRLLEPTVTALGYEYVGVENHAQGQHSLLRVYIDSEQGITLDDCERVSQQISGVLDVEAPIRGEYTLEVSSPGLDRRLFKPEHFERFAGHKVRIKLYAPIDGKHKYNGTLQGLNDDHVVIEEDGMEISLPWSSISKANLVPDL